MNHMLPQRPYLHGQWKIDKISVEVISENWGQISYEKYEVNAYRNVINVYCWIWDRMRGITLEQKMKRRLGELIIKLKADNDRIRRLHEMSERIADSEVSS